MRSAWLVLGLTWFAACAGADAMALQQPDPAPEASSSLGLFPGESMSFEVRVAGVLAGEAQLAVGQPGELDGRNALVVRSRAATAGAAALVKKISDEATTVIDVDTGRPISLDAVLENNGKRMTASAKFSGSSAEVTYQRHMDKAPRTTKLNFGKVTVYDAHTAMAQLRGWKGTKGAMRTVYVIGGRRLWRIDVTYRGLETIGSALGNRRAVVFDGRSFRARPSMASESDKPARTFSVWLSDDADRVPLKVVATTELGDIVMDLTEYNH
jgi:hypothetical protein